MLKIYKHIIFVTIFSFAVVKCTSQANDLPNPPAHLENIPIGSLVIPMDNTHQNLVAPFNLKAYGLVNALLQNDIPVKWVIRSGKLKDGIDFSATVQRVYPSALAASLQDFRGSAFIIDSTWVNKTPYSNWGQTASQIIAAFGGNVAVYKLTQNVTVDVRYNLKQRPKIAVFSNGGNQNIHTIILNNAGISNYTVISAGVFSGLAECYTFCSEAHWASQITDTAVMRKPVDFVYSGGNFLAQCHAVQAGTTDGYEAHMKIETTNGLTEIGINTLSNTYYNPDLAIMQFHGLMKANQGGSGKNWRLAPGSSWRNGHYYAVSTQNSRDTVVVSCSKLTTDSVGGNVFYMGGHQYLANAGNFTDIELVNAGRIYLNAALIPAKRPSSFSIITSPNTAVCKGQQVQLGVTGPVGATYQWTPATGLNNPASPSPIATPTVTTTYGVTAMDGSCPGGPAFTTVTVNPIPAAPVAGSSSPACVGSTLTLSANTIIGATYNWTGPNGFSSSLQNPAIANVTAASAGTYSVTATISGCPGPAGTTAVIINPTPASTPSQVNVSCYGGSNGSASVVAAGGTPAYTYLWNTSQTSSSIAGLTAGSYTATVTDSKGCKASTTVSITQPATPLSSSTAQTNVSCFAGSNGSATVIATGGTSPYTYLWSNGQTASTSTGLVAGTYSVTITDSKGCTNVASVIISQPLVLSANVSQTNVSCYGGNNGSALVSTPSGGTSPYTYLWSNGQISSSITELAIGTFSLTVTDAKGCTVSASATITQPVAALSFTTSQTNVSCFGGNNGSASVSAVGGTPGYSYMWSNGQILSNISGLSAGTYTITVTDTKGCSATGFVTITQPTALAVSFINQNNVSCFGGNNGSVTANASGGVQNYNYLWMPGSGSTNTVNGLIAGTYTVTVTDNLGCQKQNNVTITQPASALSVSVSSTPASCYAGTNGSVASVVVGGTGPYSYNWIPGNNATQNVSSLVAGTYTVTVTDSKGCTLSNSVAVNQPAAISLIPGTKNSTCSLPNGTAFISVSGGVSPYTYQWSPTGGNIDTAKNLFSGAYTVLVTDANACSTSQSLNVNDNNSPSVSIASSTNVSCYGGATGSASAGITGGTGPFTYSWAPYGGTGSIATGLIAGTYTLTVTDANGCQSLATTTPAITQPPALALTVTTTNVSCFGGSNGTAAVSASGGTAGYNYTWLPSGSAGNSITNLSAGTYTVQVTDANSCVLTKSFSINQPNQLIVSISSSSNVSCKGGSNGAANASITGGTPFYTYNWLPTGGNGPTGTGLSAGTFTVNVTDNKGCVNSTAILITEPAQALSSVSSQINVSCYGGNNGTATITASGGTSPFTYLWNNGQTSFSISGLIAGGYAVTTTDAKGCMATASVSITQPAMALTSTTTQNNVSCYGGSSGSASVIATGGTPAYSYLWSSGQTSSSPTGLTAGSYTATVTDSKGCTTVSSVSISQPAAPLSSSASQTNVSCFAGSNGSASLIAIGGTSPYTYVWSNGQTGTTATGLVAGTYSVTTTDSKNCTSTIPVTITQPALLSANIAQTDVSCYGGNNGSAIVSTPSGGTPGYSYLWSNGQISSSIIELVVGTYSLTVTDTKGCTASASATITQPVSALSFSTSQTNVSCFNGNNGSATTVAAGGTPGYFYMWSNGQTTSNISGLTAGTYTVTITDTKGCSAAGFVAITQPAVLAVGFINQSNVSCFGGNNGSVTANASGGIQNYTYLWMPGGATASAISTRAAGTYTVTVTDNQSCQVQNNVTLTQPVAALSVSVSSTPTSCYGAANGSVACIASGGTSTYSYNWLPGNYTTQNVSSLTAGTYTVTVTDLNGCTFSNSITVNQPAAISLLPGTINSTCSLPNGTAFVSVSGGISPYTYQWSPNGGNSDTAKNLLSGAYTVLVTDANTCSTSQSLNVNDNNSPTVTIISSTNVSCNGGSTGSASAGISNGTGPFTYSWAPYGGNSPNAVGLTAGTYTLTVTDINGCQSLATTSPAITEPIALALTITTTDVNCFGGSNGSAAVSASGGTPGYTFTWLPSGSTGTSITNLSAGTYTVQVTDINSCVLTKSFSINEPNQLSVFISSSTNVSCKGGNDGTATTSVSGGTPFYNYNWLPMGGNGPTGTGLSAGTYTVNVTDNKGCISSSTILITEPLQVLSSTTMQSNVSCYAGNNGTATITASGGTSSYNYLWTNGQNGSTVSGLTAGNYAVTTTDAKGCMVTSSVLITQPSVALTSTTPQNNISCYGGSDGSVSVIATGGTPAYTYLWSNGQTIATITGLAVGNYTATATDSKGCTTVASVSILQPAAPLSSSTSQTNVSCSGSSNGSATVIATGGTSPYTYLWNNGQTAATAIGLSSGSYSVTITDSKGCTNVASVTITQPAILTANITQTDVSCYGGNNGSAIVSTPSGGTPGYSYLWSNGQISSSITELIVGTYSLTVKDTKGCTASTSATITQPVVALSFTTSQTNVSCFGGSNGSATVIAAGGTPGYFYMWSNGQTTSNISSLTAGTYTLTVTDTKGCMATGFVTITQPAVLAVGFINQNNVSCFGGSNGSVTANASGGVQNYSYLWMPGSVSTATINGLQVGTYTATVTDNKGCLVQNNVTITQPVAALAVSVSSTSTSCYGGANGSVASIASGGTSPYTYNWLPGNNTTQNVSSLTAGTYTVTVADSQGCISSNSVAVNQPAAISLIPGTINSTCSSSNGRAFISVSGGISPYTYQWSPDGGNSDTANNLFSGAYTVLVTDANACSISQSLNVNDDNSPSVTIISSTNVSCKGGATGSASAGISSGTGPFSYSWAPYGGNSANATGLTAGTYTLTVTDINGCKSLATTSPAITEPSALALTVTVTDVNCFGGSNGTAAVSASGGSPGYTYTWLPGGSVGNSVTNLSAGSYTVQVTDVNSCVLTKTFIINQPNQLSVSIPSSVNVSCKGGNDGAATAGVTGGTPYYNYSWLPMGGNGPTGTGLSAGTYTVNVTDNKGCVNSTTILITEPSQALYSVTSQSNVSCFGGNNGTGTIAASGGTPSYTYLWSTGQTSLSIGGLSAGNYAVTTSDGKGCMVTASVSITQPAMALASTTAQNNISCYGGNDGSVSVIATGGTPAYTYLWSNGQTASSPAGLTVGNYTATVTDSKGCTTAATVSISQPTAPLSSSTTQTNVSCFAGSNGSATVIATGGTSPYTYLWSNGQTAATATALIAGGYSVTCTDSKGCTSITFLTISQPTSLSATLMQTNVSCYGGSNGFVAVSASGGTPFYTYSWSNGQSGSSITGQSSGTYSVTVSDIKGCAVSVSTTITQPIVALSFTASQTNVSCFGGNNGSASVSAAGGTPGYSYMWQPGNQTSNSISNLTIGTYTVTVTDTKGCSVTSFVTITQPAALAVSFINQTNVSCFGGNNGSVTANVSGGTQNYNYLWIPGNGTTAAINGLQVGTYTVTVTDNKGCQKQNNVTITQPVSALSVSVSSTPASCYGGANGSVASVASGGTGPYSYNWIPGNNTTQNVSNVSAGTYTVTATDSKGCTLSNSVIVAQPAMITLVTGTVSSTCTFSNGSAFVSVSGGVGSYTYQWSPTGGNNDTAKNLFSGAYTVLVTDANGCSSQQWANVNDYPSPSVIILSSTNVSCNGGATGSASAGPYGGTAPFSYHWSPYGGNGPIATGLTAGTYTLTVVDSNGCQSIATTTPAITEPSALTLTVTTTNVSCFGGSNGSAAVSAVGGTPGYSYIWLPGGSIGNSIANLSAGTYTVQVTDANSCVLTKTFLINQPNQLSATIPSSSNVSCKGGNDGTATASVSGGTPFYNYSWLPMGGNGPTGTELSAGTYTVNVTDNKGCVNSTSVLITEPSQALSSVSSQSNVSCYNGNDGTATITASGGTLSYTYLWNNGQTSSSIGALSAGNYVVATTDAKGCSTSASIVIIEPTYTLSASTSQNNVSCRGGNDGAASVAPSGGTSPYSYLWNTGETTSFITGLTTANYSVTITDFKGCTSTLSVIAITEPSTALSLTASQNNVSCYVGSNGAASITATGGTPPYTYQWNNGPTASSNTGLNAGNYSVITTDAKGCIASSNISIFEPSILSSTAVQTNICSGASNGWATVSASGGTLPYSYLWTDGQTTSSVTGLSVGSYSVTITDANGCNKLATVAITLFPAIFSTASQTNVSCYGGNNGSASIVASGGTAPFTYLWNNGLNTSSITGLFSGNYTVTVMDNNGCAITTPTSITQPVTALTAVTSQINVSCFEGNNGSASVTPSGGTPSYSYQWNNAQTTSSIAGLTAGNYNVVITDTNGCMTSAALTIMEPPTALSQIAAQSNVSCFAGSNGSVSISVSGGVSPYTYLWSNGQTNASMAGLTAGDYSVTSTDISGCTAVTSITITEPAVLSSSAVQTNICTGATNGLATVSVSGGTLPYAYMWSNGQTNSSANGLSAGNYSVTTTDAKGCTEISIGTITQFPPVFSSTSQTNVSCNAGNNGTASVIPSGGTVPYAYEWNNGGSTSSITGLTAGNYTSIVTDVNGCTTTASALIIEPSQLIVSFGSVINTTCYNGSNGSASATSTGGVFPYLYNWSTSPVQTNNIATNLSAGTHTVTVTDSNGCVSANTVMIAQPSQVITLAGANDSICLGQSGVVTATASGGGGGYSYIWLPSNTTNSGALTVAPTSTTTYTVTAQDQYGCVGTLDTTFAVIYHLNPADIEVTGASPICPGQSSIISVRATGTTGALTYLWNNNLGTGAGPYTVIPSQPTTYMVTVTNQCGSSVTEAVQVLFNPPPTVNLTSDFTQMCVPAIIQFSDNSVTGNITDPITSWNWNFNDGTSSTLQNPAHSYTQSGTYSIVLTVTTLGGCTNNNLTTPLTITAHPIPTAAFSVNSINLDLPYDVLNCTNLSVDANIYKWNFGDGNTSNSANPQNIYTNVGIFQVQLIAISQYGCRDTSYAEVTTNVDVVFPNVFTPNKDGSVDGNYDINNLDNNIFFPYTSGVIEYKLQIFNRWGEEIFESLDIKKGWSGYYKGALCQQDVYVYKAYIKLNNGKVFNKNGDVTLLR